MCNIPIRLSDFTRSKLDPKTSRKRTLQALKKYYKAQEDLEKICSELGIPVPEMIMNVAGKAKVPADLLKRVTIELAFMDIKNRVIDQQLVTDLKKLLEDIFAKEMQAEWRGFKPAIKLMYSNRIPILDIYLGSQRIITLK